MPLDPVASYRLSLIDRFMTPEARKKYEEWRELSKQPSKTPWSEAEAIARFERAKAKPDLNYLCRIGAPE